MSEDDDPELALALLMSMEDQATTTNEEQRNVPHDCSPDVTQGDEMLSAPPCGPDQEHEMLNLPSCGPGAQAQEHEMHNAPSCGPVAPSTAPVAAVIAAATSQEMASSCLRDGRALPPASMAPPPIAFNRQESLFMTAIYDCVGENEDELSFKVGDLIEIKRIGAADRWCVGCLVDKPERPGLFPSSYAINT